MGSEQIMSQYRPGKSCGFRISGLDAIVLLLVVVATVVSYSWLGVMAWLFVIVAGHFFLFCNIFRIQRFFELIWAGLFVLNVSMWFVMDAFDWWWVLAVQSPVTILFIVMSFLKQDYHGVFWRHAPYPRQVSPMEKRQQGALL